MIIDHSADMLWEMPIAKTNVRMLTRLAMPLFCVLAGYLVARRTSLNWTRVGQVALASVAASIISYSCFQRLEILASILLVLLVFPVVSPGFGLLVGLAALVAVDPTASLLDFPFTVVAACMAAGAVLRSKRRWLSLACAAWLVLASVWVASPTAYVLWWAPLAMWLIHLAESGKLPSWRLLATIGRYPLVIYVAQYYVLWAMQYLVRSF